MSTVLTDVDGDYWGAAGAAVWVFGFVYADVLITVEAGKTLQFGVIGLARGRIPQSSVGGTTDPVAVVLSVVVAVVVAPAAGYLQVSATISPASSYILDPKVTITGAAAVYVWWGGGHAGDFVISLGGYNPQYDVPSHYPWVPRLGITWKTKGSGAVTWTGQAYLAITPKSFQLGGLLQLNYKNKDGSIVAYLKVQADFLIQWQPVSYDIYLGVAVGCAFKLLSHTVKAEVGANLALYGPPFYGVVVVNLWVISFTIEFGTQPASTQPPTAVDWTTFATTFLSDTVCTLQAGAGLTGQQPSGGWLLSVDGFSFTTRTVIPCTAANLSVGGTAVGSAAGSTFGVAPMAVSAVTASVLTIEVTGADTATATTGSWQVAPVTSALPAALWGTTQPSTQTPPAPADELLAGQLVGLQVEAAATTGESTQVNLADLTDSLGSAPLTIAPYSDAPPPPPPAPPPDSWSTVATTVTSTSVTAARHNILAAAADWGATCGLTVDLDQMASDPQLDLPSAPRVGALGSFTDQPPAAPDVAASAPSLAPPLSGRPTSPQAADGTASPQAADGTAQRRPMLVASARQHRHPGRRRAPSSTQLGEAWRVSSRVYSTLGVPGPTASLRASLGGATDGTVELTAGCTVLWQAPPGQQLTALHSDGPMTLRLVCFDRHQRLLADTLAAGGEHRLPDGATRLVVVGHGPPRVAPAVSGWLASSRLLVANPVAVIVEGGVIRPQAPVRVGAGSLRRPHGVTSGARVARGNRVRTARGIEAGWMEHTLAGTTRTLAVLLTSPGETGPGGAPAAGGAAEGATVFEANGRGPAVPTGQRLWPADAVVDGNRARLLYRLSAATVSVRPGPGWELAGVAGFPGDVETVAARWEDAVLDASYAADPHGPAYVTRLRLSTSP